MSIDLYENYLNRSSSIYTIDAIEITHPIFSIYLQRFVENIITVKHENGLDCSYRYAPMDITLTDARDDLDQVIELKVMDSDLTNMLETAMRLLPNTKPRMTYRSYRSDDLTEPMYILKGLLVSNAAFAKHNVIQLEAKAMELNENGSGLIYTFEDFQLLRGFI